KRQDFGPTSLYAELQERLAKDAWARVCASQQGVLYVERDYNLMVTSERAAVTARKTLHKGVWTDSLDIEERPDYAWPVKKVKMSGLRYPGGGATVIPYFSEAPGDLQKVFGRENPQDRKILTTQADLNERCGLQLAKDNQRWHTVRGRFVNEGSFGVVPQNTFPAVIESGDNNRGLSWTPDLVPRRIRRGYDHDMGTIDVEVEFEPSSTGASGVTVLMPPEPPTQTPTLPPWDPPPIPPITPPSVTTPLAAGAADGALGAYYTDDKGATWERRVNGLYTGATGTSQLYFNYLIYDGWWWTPSKQGTSDPEYSIWWGCGPNFLVRSVDAGKHWQDYTPNVLASTSAPTGSANVFNFVQIHDDIHNDGTFYMLAERYDTTDARWKTWIVHTADDWITCDWHEMTLLTVDEDTGHIYLNGYTGHSFTLPGGGTWLEGVTNPENVSAEDDDCMRAYAIYQGGAVGPELYMSIDFDLGTEIIVCYNHTDDDGYNVSHEIDANNSWGVTDAFEVRGKLLPGDGFTTFYSINPEPARYYGVNYDPGFPATTCFTFRYVRLFRAFRLGNGIGNTYYSDVDFVRFYASGTADPGVRPLAMDLDSENSSRLYVTAWTGAGDIRLFRYDTLNLDSAPAHFQVGQATDQEVFTSKTYYAVPRSPHLPGVAGFGDFVYLFGRWDDGTLRHVMLSTDGGGNFTDLGDGQWTGTAYRVGGFSAPDAGNLYAFLNAASPRLWTTVNTGSAWTDLNSIPFSVEHGAVSRHSAGDLEFLIGSNAAGSVQAAWQATPYTGVWIDATGVLGQRLPTAADGGSDIKSIFWLGIPLT
ncbi:MAG: hypothetical protein ACFFDE_11880, partial [Promethearchaeota archaeon]